MRYGIRIVAFTAVMLVLLGSGSGLSQDQGAKPADGIASVEERRIRYSLQQERARLAAEYQQREEKIAVREIELKTLAAEVDKKLNELKSERRRLEKLLEQKSEIEVKRIKSLSRIYEKMEPAKAAKTLSELEQGLAVDILAGMKPKSAGKLLNSMDKSRAARLSKAYAALGAE